MSDTLAIDGLAAAKPEPLTLDQVRALRNADDVSFEFQRAERWEFTGHLRLIREVKRNDGFGPERLEVRIPTRCIVNQYGSSGCEDDQALPRAASGSWLILYARQSPAWQTAASLLRRGDELVQVWTVDNRTVQLSKAGLTIHELSLRIMRPLAHKEGHYRVLDLMLDARVEQAATKYGTVAREDS